MRIIDYIIVKCFFFETVNDAEEISQKTTNNDHRPKAEIVDYRPKEETNDVGTNFPEKRISNSCTNNHYLSNLSYERPTLERLHSLNIEKVVAKIYDNVEQLQRCSFDSTLVTKEIKFKELPSPEIVTIVSRNNSEATPEKFNNYLEQNKKSKDEMSPRQVSFLSTDEQKRENVDEEASTNLVTVTELSSPFWTNENVQTLFKEVCKKKYL